MMALLMATAVQAQPKSHNRWNGARSHAAKGPIGYMGLRLGANGGFINADNTDFDDHSLKAGFNIGLAMGLRVAFVSPVYLETGLMYTEKGGKINNGHYNGNSSYSMKYLEVPLVLKYRHPINRSVSIQPYAGVYGAVGVGGKYKNRDERVSYGSFSDQGFKRWDSGLRMGCGLKFGALYTELGCDLGLKNISRDSFEDANTTTFYANMGIGF